MLTERDSLETAFQELFGTSGEMVTLRSVEVDPERASWNVEFLAPETVKFESEQVQEQMRQAFPFLQDVQINRALPGSVSEICAAPVLGARITAKLGLAENTQWRFDGNTLIAELVEGERSDAREKIAQAVESITGMTCKVRAIQKKQDPGKILLGKSIAADPMDIAVLDEESGTVVVEGEVFAVEYRKTKAKRGDVPMSVLTIKLTDYTSSIVIKRFDSDIVCSELSEVIKEGLYLKVRGDCRNDKFTNDLTISAQDIVQLAPRIRQDTLKDKRVELHLHTSFSSMDALGRPKDVVKTAIAMGHSAVAITDHGVVQAFPEAAEAARGKIKIILGVEAYLTSDDGAVTRGVDNYGFDGRYVVVDLETTGLEANSCGITEIAAVMVDKGGIVDEFQTFVHPGRPIPAHITHLTGITDDMVANAPKEAEALRSFQEFAQGCPLVAHNAPFDLGFITIHGRNSGLVFDNGVVDTLSLSRALFPTLRRHKLDVMCKKLNVTLENHHRAINDARATASVFLKLLDMAKRNYGVRDIKGLNAVLSKEGAVTGDYHCILLVQNKAGLKNLYRLVSEAHLHHFHSKPRMPKSLVRQYREGLIIGSACEAGELFTAILQGREEDAEEIAKFYDYLEIQPDGNNEFLLRNGRLPDVDALHAINRKIIDLGKKLGKLVVATGDVHFIKPQDEYYRRILQAGQGYNDADHQPPLFFKTTGEMLGDFAYLGEEMAYDVVIRNTNLIAEMVENVEPLPPYQLYAPRIDGAEEYIVELSEKTARSIYGDELPPIVAARLERELVPIRKYGFSVLFYIAHKLVQKSLSDDYLVGSRGSVGSSFVATMAGITEVNPLPPHYVCPNCKHSDFEIDVTQYACGPDLPDRDCPECGTKYRKEGYDIPFEVFLGFEGDKVPDIDLNFSGEYQSTMHKYTEELFGEGNVFRAGTISTVAERTAYGFAKNYLQEKNVRYSRAELDRLVAGCTGVKRTTGQHPGGIIVVPKEYEIYDFTPIQHPADDRESGTITTHFDFNSLHDRLVKLDILGHDDPTMLRMLKDLTGIDPRSIPLDDKKTMSLFCSTEALGVTPQDIDSNMGTYGVPEFGTHFVRGMLEDTMPTTMAELVRISGLSHGTDVWLNNAQDLIKNGTATLKEAVCTRDDIMNYLIQCGVAPKMAFDTMENVRKGRGLKPAMEEAMEAQNVPSWFMDSCRKIGYMFPKAHAVAYVTMGFRVAWYKVYYPREYYATYYTVRADDFDAELMLGDISHIRAAIKELDALEDQKQKDKNKLTILEIVLEMLARGLQFTNIDLYKSHSVKFLLTEEGAIRPPLNALPGLGNSAAQGIMEARKDGPFVSEEDLKSRAGISSAVLDVLRKHNCLGGMSATNQLSLFELLA